MAFQFRDLLTRWHNRRRPQACPSTPDCPGQPTNSLARFALANERLRCGECGKAALALYWRREAALRAGAFLREPADAAHQQAPWVP
jgi:hypothetical protein